MKKTYLFYDIETSGLNKCFDQILQFAAIRTDLELNELSRHEIWLKPNPDLVPAPRATLTHRISLTDLMDGKSELEGIEEIHELVNTPGTISLGYNTLKFDDEFLRFAFSKNLLTPYSHQYANQCSRVDIYPMTVMYYLFKQDTLSWPMLNNKVSLKLEHINAENKLTEGAAHNAMVDVIATLELAKLLKQEQEMWQYLLDYFDKETDHQRTTKLTSAFKIKHHDFKQGILVDGIFGFAQQYQSVVLCLGQHNHYKNQTLWLRLDHQLLSELTDENRTDNTWVIKKKPAEPGFLLPTIPRFLTYIDDERQSLVDQNLAWLEANPDLLQQIIDHHRDFTFEKVDLIDPDAALYQMGFLLPHENQLCEKFHQVDAANKIKLLDEFQNPILREKAIRILGRSHPDLLSGSAKDEFEQYLASLNNSDQPSLLDYKGQPRLSPQAAIQEVNEILSQEAQTLDAEQRKLLHELSDYLQQHFNIVGQPA